MNPLSAILGIGEKLLDRFLPDPKARDEAKLQMLQLIQAGEFREIEAGLERARIEAGDREGARQMQSATKDRTPRVIALVYVGGFFAVLVATFFVRVPTESAPLLNVLLGALAAGVVQILAFYFGSSSGSKEKTEYITARRAAPSPESPERPAIAAPVRL